MVVPDGALNNSGEGSHCPAFRRFLLCNARVEMIVSLPDFAFRKAGAQNKTSLLFLRKFSEREKGAFDRAYEEYMGRYHAPGGPTPEQEKKAIRHALQRNPYRVFLAEVELIGYTPAGAVSAQNELYATRDDGRLDLLDTRTVLGQFGLYRRSPGSFSSAQTPTCKVVDILTMLDAHPSYRLDPKFHVFRLEERPSVPEHMKEHRLGDLLKRREEEVQPASFPDQEFVTLTLTQEGAITPREAGKGNNPPSWHGAYFTTGSRWYRAHAGDLIISQIDVWKGCVAVIPEEFDQAIVTQEFPLYQVDLEELDPRYLALLLRSEYFQRAIRAITTGHSNRRRTQSGDFEELKIFLPELDVQKRIAEIVERSRQSILVAEGTQRILLTDVEEVILGRRDPTLLAGNPDASHP